MGRRWILAGRASSRDLQVFDAGVGACLTAAGLAGLPWRTVHGTAALASALATLAATASVVGRRRWPAAATLVGVTGLVAFQVVNGHTQPTVQPLAVSLDFYLLGRAVFEGRRSVSAAALAYAFGAVTLISVRLGQATAVGVLTRWAFGIGLPFAAGRILARRAGLRRALEATAAALEREEELTVRQAAEGERTRMARELHDVIAHNLSVMVIQTQAARRIAHHDRPAACDAMRAVAGAGREALIELRRITGVVRRGEDDPLGAAPGVADLGALVERTRAAGLAVDLENGSPGAPLPAGVDSIVYRIVQEALTNVLKHAGPARAVVQVRVGAEAVEVDVSDTGRGLAPVPLGVGGSGHGLVGMRERVSLYGGELHAGRRPEGGFVVHARIPLGPVP